MSAGAATVVTRATQAREPPLLKKPRTAWASTLASVTPAASLGAAPNLRVNSLQLVTSCGTPAGATVCLAPGAPSARWGISTLSGTTPMKPATLVLTPAIGAKSPMGPPTTYTPGDRYAGMFSPSTCC